MAASTRDLPGNLRWPRDLPGNLRWPGYLRCRRQLPKKYLPTAGELTAVHVPGEREEAIRDLCRARTDAMQDQRSGRNQLKAFLLCHGYRYTDSTAWSQAHMRYLRELVLPHAAMKIVLEEPERSADSRSAAKPAGRPSADNYLQCIDSSAERIERL